MKNFFLIICAVFALGISTAWAQNGKYIVKKGDTIASIASAHNITPKELIELNPDITTFMYAGMELKLPAVAVVAPAAKPAPVVAEAPVVSAPEPTSTDTSKIYKQSKAEDFDGDYFIYFNACYHDVGYTGSYGLGWHLLFSISDNNKLRFGGMLGMQANFGLAYEGMDGLGGGLGPVIAYEFAPKVKLCFPVTVNYGCPKSLWRLSIAPTLHIKHFHFGPAFNINLNCPGNYWTWQVGINFY